MRTFNKTVALVAVIAAVAIASGGCPAKGGREVSQDSTTTTTAPPATATTKAKVTKPPKKLSLDELLDVAFADIEDFWSAHFKDLYGKKYEPISGGFHAYGPNEPPDACGGRKPTYEQFKDNAVYCGVEDEIQWDEEGLIKQIYNEFGQYSVAFVFAHEWGHAIQKRSGLMFSKDSKGNPPPTIQIELQADCFAGAWSKHLLEEGGDKLKIGISDLQFMVAGALKYGDPVGISAEERGAHGAGFDRLNAMQDGFDSGIERCKTYDKLSGVPKVVEFPFEPGSTDESRGGNMPYDKEMFDEMSTDLNEYWQTIADKLGFTFEPITKTKGYSSTSGKFPKCGDKQYSEDDATGAIFYCDADKVVYYDDDFTNQVYEQTGDFGVAILFAHQWAVAEQVQNGQKEDTLYSSLQASCFTGTWTGSIIREDRVTPAKNGKPGTGIVISPGDLDEAAAAFLAYSEKPDQKGNTKSGSAFQRLQAFRDGFYPAGQDKKGGLAGEQVCIAYTESDANTK